MKQNVTTVGYILLALVFLALLVGAVYVSYTVVYPWVLDARRNAVEHSDSFVDSTNIAMMNLISEYEGSDNDSHRSAILNQLCLKYVTMPEEVINPGIIQWLFKHGGCK